MTVPGSVGDAGDEWTQSDSVVFGDNRGSKKRGRVSKPPY